MVSQSESADKTRVLVVEDHAIIREGVCLLLAAEPDIQVIGSVGTGEAAVEFVKRNRPDVVVMDLGLPDMSGIEATRKIREISLDIRVMVLTMYTDDQYVLGVLDAGAIGFLLKQSAVNDLTQAVRSVSVGQYFFPPSATKAVLEAARKGRELPTSYDALTDREKDMLKMIAQGFTSKEIGEKLFLSPRTIDNYRARMLEKLQAKNSLEAVAIAVKQGIIEPV